MLLETPEKYYKVMKALCDSSDESIITSFGVFCCFTVDNDLSDRFISEDRKFIDSISNNKNVSIIVGVGGFTPCKKNCDQCGISYARRTLRIERHRQEYPNLHWYICESLHSKVAAFRINGKYVSIIGSRNFTGSVNKEMAITIEGQSEAKELFEYALMLKNSSKPVSIDTVIESVILNSDARYIALVT